MTEPPYIPPRLASSHFELVQRENAFGKTLRLRELDHTEIILFQPRNAWAEQHWAEAQTDSNHRNLLMILEAAYNKGYLAAREEMRKALGLNG